MAALLCPIAASLYGPRPWSVAAWRRVDVLPLVRDNIHALVVLTLLNVLANLHTHKGTHTLSHTGQNSKALPLSPHVCPYVLLGRVNTVILYASDRAPVT